MCCSSCRVRWPCRWCIPGHTSIGGTLPLTETTVTTNATGGVQLTGTGARVHGDGLADDEAILDELADGLARVGVGNLAGLVGVEPDLALAAADNGGRKALLRAEVDPVRQFRQYSALVWCCGRRRGRVCKEGLATSRDALRAAPRVGEVVGQSQLLLDRWNLCLRPGSLHFR